MSFTVDFRVITVRTNNDASAPNARKSSRLPVVLSFVFPGLGQLAQGRRVVGLTFLVATLIGLTFFVIASVRILATFYSLATSSGLMSASASEAPSFWPMLSWLGITLLVYGVAVWDANEACKRFARKQNQARLDARLAETMQAVGPPALPSQSDPG